MTEFYTLKDGLSLPKIGFGTSGFRGTKAVAAISSAITKGYRLIDTAYNYENEGTVGQAIKKAKIAREDLLISSKLPGRYHKHDLAIQAIQESLYRADLDYFDLYLIHWPNPKQGEYLEAWQALIDAQKFGLVRSIGVSNFLPEHLDQLEKETGILPVVNQIELHPLFSQPSQRAYHEEHGILTEAWSPLGGHGHNILELPLIQQLAKKYNKNAGQIVLRWETQLGVLPLPLSQNPQRQLSNLDIFDFELTRDEIKQIESLDIADGRVTNQDPRTHEEL